MTLSTIDTIIVLAYLVGIFVLAQWVSREKAGHQKDAKDYFLASKSLPWWAIGASLIAANISAEQIIGMSGSGYALGLAIASYEWMAALTLLIVGKFFLPVFLRNGIYTMPQFLEERYGPRIRTIMAVFWLGLYVFVNLTSILWLGSIAVTQVTGMSQFAALALLGGFALIYQLYGGLKAVALTDIVQVSLLVLGGLLIVGISLDRIGGDAGVLGGFKTLMAAHPDHFQMILDTRQSVLQGSAGPERADRRHVDHECQLLGLQPVHHPARAGGEGHRRSAEGRGVRGVPEAADAGDRGAAGHRRADAGDRYRQARSGLSEDDGAAADRRARAGVRGVDRGDRGVAGVEDQFGLDHLHPRFLHQDAAAGRPSKRIW